MISIAKERRILELLGQKKPYLKIALHVGVSRDTVSAVKNNQTKRSALRIALAGKRFTATRERTNLPQMVKCPTCEVKTLLFPCVYCYVRTIPPGKLDDYNHELKLDRLLGTTGGKFVRIVKDILNIDAMRVIHHPLFASLVKQSRDTVALLPKEENDA